MSSWASDEHARRTMKANRSRDTNPELAIRRRLHAMGLRYRVDFRLAPPLRTRADIVFTRKRLAVFVDGCFWHRCPLHSTPPRRNADYWGPKLDGNSARDRRTDAALADAGWRVLRVWEHEDPDAAAERILRAAEGT